MNELKFVNLFGKPIPQVEVSIKKLDDRIYKDSFKKVGKTNSEGKIKLKLKEGKYIILAKKNRSKQAIIASSERRKIVLIPFFGKMPINWDNQPWMFKETIKSGFDKYREDHIVCHKCRKRYPTWTNKFKCKYCKFSHCDKHRIPEEHECAGSPRNPYSYQRWPKYP